MFQGPVIGETGRVWIVDERHQACTARRGLPFFGWEEGKEDVRVWVQRISGGDGFNDHRAHVRRAWEMSKEPTITESPFICSAIDFAQGFDTYLFHDLADLVLDEAARKAQLSRSDGEAVGHNV